MENNQQQMGDVTPATSTNQQQGGTVQSNKQHVQQSDTGININQSDLIYGFDDCVSIPSNN